MRFVTDDQYFTNLLVYDAFLKLICYAEESYLQHCSCNQFAMQKSHSYSIAVISTLKA